MAQSGHWLHLDRLAMGLLRRMLANGVSRYDPDPLKALSEE
jgi:hypothetical protein